LISPISARFEADDFGGVSLYRVNNPENAR
jgi:hypothetical protein